MSQDKMSLPITLTRDKIVSFTRISLGVKWKHQGRDTQVGIDCAGLVVLVARELGLSTYDATNYQRNARDGAFVRHFADNMRKKPVFDRKEGDVLLFRDKLFSCHSGILTRKNGTEHFVHAYAKYKKVVEEPLTDEWLSKVSHCFEFYGVEK